MLMRTWIKCSGRMSAVKRLIVTIVKSPLRDWSLSITWQIAEKEVTSWFISSVPLRDIWVEYWDDELLPATLSDEKITYKESCSSSILILTWELWPVLPGEEMGEGFLCLKALENNLCLFLKAGKMMSLLCRCGVVQHDQSEVRESQLQLPWLAGRSSFHDDPTTTTCKLN